MLLNLIFYNIPPGNRKNTESQPAEQTDDSAETTNKTDLSELLSKETAPLRNADHRYSNS